MTLTWLILYLYLSFIFHLEKKKHGWRNLTGKGEKKKRGQKWWLANVDRESRNVGDQQVIGIFCLSYTFADISTELFFIITKQDLAPVALCSEVRRIFKDDRDNPENFPSFCMSSGCWGRGPSFLLSLVFAIFPLSPGRLILTEAGRIMFYSTLSLFAI